MALAKLSEQTKNDYATQLNSILLKHSESLEEAQKNAKLLKKANDSTLDMEN